MKNPFTKAHLNLDEQGRLLREDPDLFKKLKAEAPSIDAEIERQKRTRKLNEFNELDIDQKIKFIQRGGEIV